ncbi:MAG TPA: hypothetical protein ENF87_02110 [Thermoproteales archaeon]|nr:hypothetical protein [Thermoproteales archaeon]
MKKVTTFLIQLTILALFLLYVVRYAKLLKEEGFELGKTLIRNILTSNCTNPFIMIMEKITPYLVFALLVLTLIVFIVKVFD